MLGSWIEFLVCVLAWFSTECFLDIWCMNQQMEFTYICPSPSDSQVKKFDRICKWMAKLSCEMLARVESVASHVHRAPLQKRGGLLFPNYSSNLSLIILFTGLSGQYLQWLHMTNTYTRKLVHIWKNKFEDTRALLLRATPFKKRKLVQSLVLWHSGLRPCLECAIIPYGRLF